MQIKTILTTLMTVALAITAAVPEPALLNPRCSSVRDSQRLQLEL